MTECVAKSCSNEVRQGLCSKCRESDEIPELERLPDLDYSNRSKFADEVQDVLDEKHPENTWNQSKTDIFWNEDELWIILPNEVEIWSGIEKGKGLRIPKDVLEELGGGGS